MAKGNASRGSRSSMGAGKARARPARRSAGGPHPTGGVHRMGRVNSTRMASETGGMGQFSNRGGHGHGGGYRGYKSKVQWRWAWASHQPWARKKAHETAGGPKVRYRRLPESKHSGHEGSRVPK